jgi:two-component system, OmpR family, response regulator
MNPKKQINIFIVDDNKVFSMTLKTYLETALVSPLSTNFAHKNIKVHLFETGEACMEKFSEEKPQVVILDYHLNNRYPNAADGIKVLDWIKKASQETYVVMLTNEDNLEIAKKSFKHGASDYVVKTETQFDKINYSLLNLFKMMEIKNENRRYKLGVFAMLLMISLLALVAIAIQIFNPSFF